MTAFEQAWAFLKADFSDLSGGEGLGRSHAAAYMDMARNAPDEPGPDGRATRDEIERAAIDAMTTELTAADINRLYYGDKFDPYIHETPFFSYRGRSVDQPKVLGLPAGPKKLGVAPGMSVSRGGDPERFTDFQFHDVGRPKRFGPLGGGQQQ